MNQTVQSFISAAYRASTLRNGVIAEVTEGNVCPSRASAANAAKLSRTDKANINCGKFARGLAYCSAGVSTERKYEDMTSRRIEVVETGNDHDVSCKRSFFRETKKRRPPEVGNLLQAQGQHDLQARMTGNSKSLRVDSSSWLAAPVTPDICGESELTAETHMAEESSKSSNNGGSSTFESAVESASKGPAREFQTVSGAEVLHSFLDHSDGGLRRVLKQTLSEGPSPRNILAKIDEDNNRKEMDSNHHGNVASSERTRKYQHRCGSTEPPPSGIHTGEQSSNEWLQLGVGSSLRGASPKPAASTGKPPSFRQADEGRNYVKRRITTSTELRIAGNSVVEHYRNILPDTSLIPIQWQVGRSSAPPSGEMDPSCTVTTNPASLCTLPTPLIGSGIPEASPKYDIDGTNLCLFGSSLVPNPSPQLVLAPVGGSVIRRLSADNRSRSEYDKLVPSVVTNDTVESYRDQDSYGVIRDEQVANTLLGRSELHNRTGPSLVSTPINYGQFGLGKPGIVEAPQFRRDNRPHSVSALMHTREDQLQAGCSRLSEPESARKLIRLANNFQGWSSDLTSSTTVPTLSARHGLMDMHSNPIDLQIQASSDEWERIMRRVGPNSIFQSHSKVAEGLSAGSLGLFNPTGGEKNAVLDESPENLMSLRHHIDNKRPQWTSSEPSNLGSMASWCFNGKDPPGRSETIVERFVGSEQLRISSTSDRVPVHSRFTGDHILNAMPSQRQSWQPIADYANLHQVAVNVLKRPSAPTVSTPKVQGIPPRSIGTTHAGLWFILQSAENQTGEGGLPQISKAYLRIKDGKIPVSAVKKYLVAKLGLSSESEVEITCKGQPVVPSLPLQHVRDVIWFSSLNANIDQKTSQGEADVEYSHHQNQRPSATYGVEAGAAKFSKDIIMVLTYRRHPRTVL